MSRFFFSEKFFVKKRIYEKIRICQKRDQKDFEQYSENFLMKKYFF